MAIKIPFLSRIKKYFAARTARRIAAKSPAQFVKLSSEELTKVGFSPKSERYKEIGQKIRKGMPTISKRTFQEKGYGVTLEAAVKGRESGARSYKGGEKTRAAAIEQRRTRIVKKLDSLKERDAAVSRLRERIRKDRSGDIHEASNSFMNVVRRAREKKLRGGYLEWGEYHALLEHAEATGDPILTLLKLSPKTTPFEEAA